MTKEDRDLSIEYLEGIKNNYIEGHGYERHPVPEYYAIENAIIVLSQHTCEDTISRKEVINTIQDWLKTAMIADGKPTLCDSIRDLPSVTPIRPKGHWIVEKRGYLGMRNGQCSYCNDYYTNDWNEMHYCPNCGAEMVELQESEEIE